MTLGLNAGFLWWRWSWIGLCLTLLAGCAAKEPLPQALETQTGAASFYGAAFQGQETASGETFNQNELVAAHPTYPLGTKVRVINLDNGRAVEVKINDRGPTRENQAEGVIIDLSKAAAKSLEFVGDGRARVRVEVLKWGEAKEPK